MPKVEKELFHILKGIKPFLAGADLHNIFHIVHKNLSVSDMACIKNLFRC